MSAMQRIFRFFSIVISQPWQNAIIERVNKGASVTLSIIIEQNKDRLLIEKRGWGALLKVFAVYVQSLGIRVNGQTVETYMYVSTVRVRVRINVSKHTNAHFAFAQIRRAIIRTSANV